MKTSRILASFSLAAALVCSAGESVAPGEAVVLPDLAFPLQLLHRGVTSGEVHVMLKVGPDMRLKDALVTAYTHKAFADATLAALAQGTFHPQRIDGQPVTTLVPLIVRFEVNGLLVVERFANSETELRAGDFAYQPCEAARLDRPLQILAAPSPGCLQGVRGQVIVEYYVDESGRVRMPEIVEAENAVLAGLSLQAVEQWQFTPPSCKGRPVLVRVRQAFVFAPEKAS
ncbi:MAG: TonB family protein [Opitutae bacterium]|nr:TonB family protein [Opitutae bacterium]